MSYKKINGYRLNLNKQLGRGNFGVVYHGQQDHTKIQCAIKMLDKMQIDSDDYIRCAILRQIQIIKNIKCQHIVGFYDVMQSSRYYYIIQQLCDMDLEILLKKHNKFNEKQSIQYLTQICDGFLCLIKQGIVHRDLKPANIMLKQNVVKLGDFGMAKRCRNKRIKIDSSVGSPLYMPLQLLKQLSYSSKCDIWSVGCVFYQMLHGKTPWFARTQYALVSIIQTQPLIIDQKLSDKTKDFLKKCLQKKQSDRISWDQLFLHPIFQGKFLKYTQRSKQFENKLKMIMSDIRFQINVENLDLRKLFDRLGFDDKTVLNFKNFDQFIKIVNPSITSQQVIYFFEKLDRRDDGRISITELQKQMLLNYISFQNDQIDCSSKNSQFLISQSLSRKSSIQRKRLNQHLQFKIKKCFIKLYKILNQRKLTLYKTFKTYDSKKENRLCFADFKNILSKLDSKLTQKQIILLFDFIDKDNSQSIQFDQINAYYSRVNGVPEVMDLPPLYHYKKGQIKNQRNTENQFDLVHYFKK